MKLYIESYVESYEQKLNDKIWSTTNTKNIT